MDFLSFLLAALMGLIAFAQAAPAPSDDGLKTITVPYTDPASKQVLNRTYNLVDIQWNVPINNSATPYNLSVTGTIQDVFNNISHVDPVTATKIYQDIIQLNSTLNTTEALFDGDELSSRAPSDYTPINLDCWVNMNKYDRASVYYIWQGIDYLESVPGTPGNGPGPGNCGRVSCSYSSAIYWCNDNLSEKVLDTYKAISSGAELVIKGCHQGGGFMPGGMSNGQQFYEDGWNVFVHGDSC